MSGLRRGFKTQANKMAREVRDELGLDPAAPLDPLRLAEHLEIPVLPLQTFGREIRAVVKHFTRVDVSAFSAVTVFRGTERLIVYNDAHSDGRQSSNVAHEISHALLQHPPAPALDRFGCRDWDPMLEGEADWLAGALLVSDEAALHIATKGMTIRAAATAYGVSQTMMRFRINVSGAAVRVARARRHRGR